MQILTFDLFARDSWPERSLSPHQEERKSPRSLTNLVSTFYLIITTQVSISYESIRQRQHHHHHRHCHQRRGRSSLLGLHRGLFDGIARPASPADDALLHCASMVST